MAHPTQESNILRAPRSIPKGTQEIVREAKVKFICCLNFRHILRTELEAECLHVSLKMLHLAAANNREEIGCLGRWSVAKKDFDIREFEPPFAGHMQEPPM